MFNRIKWTWFWFFRVLKIINLLNLKIVLWKFQCIIKYERSSCTYMLIKTDCSYNIIYGNQCITSIFPPIDWIGNYHNFKLFWTFLYILMCVYKTTRLTFTIPSLMTRNIIFKIDDLGTRSLIIIKIPI